ncbi:MAG: hypothetical protein MZV64_09410 [Ignavibacteriales bacterium]|nr:hypothetical protein [Ignavibacteriales bacterium]
MSGFAPSTGRVRHVSRSAFPNPFQGCRATPGGPGRPDPDRHSAGALEDRGAPGRAGPAPYLHGRGIRFPARGGPESRGVRILVDRLSAAGYAAELVPASVSAGYRADLFVSVHADRADRPDRRGWKLSPLAAEPGIPAACPGPWPTFRDLRPARGCRGVTANMRGYFDAPGGGIPAPSPRIRPRSWWRWDSQRNPEDRARMRDNPSLYAGILFEGIRSFLAGSDREDLDSLVPVLYRGESAGPGGTEGRASPSVDSPVLERYPSGRYFSVVDSAEGGWFEVFSRPPARHLGARERTGRGLGTGKGAEALKG